MPEIRIEGPPQNILDACEIMKKVTSTRKVMGWPIFQEDEEWIYETQQDEKVCPVCETYGYNRDYRGSEIPLEFPEKTVVEPTLVEPNIHDMSEFLYLRGKCRCYIWWKDYMFTLLMRLDDELRSTLISTIEKWGFVRENE